VIRDDAAGRRARRRQRVAVGRGKPEARFRFDAGADRSGIDRVASEEVEPRSRAASSTGSPSDARSPASASACAFRVTIFLVIEITLAESASGGAFAMLQAWPSTRNAASTRAGGSVSATAGSTKVSGDNGMPRSPMPSVKETLPPALVFGSK
jgi:hypothetical protein